jgi:pimeloyl-ACP methyl ester carboxylesterase
LGRSTLGSLRPPARPPGTIVNKQSNAVHHTLQAELQWIVFPGARLFEELRTFDARMMGLRFELPIFIIQGESDLMTPTELAARYCEDIQAPLKQFVMIEQAGHLAEFAQPEQFLRQLLNHVRPLVVGAPVR